MADIKITDLPAYSTVTSPTGDVLEIVDITNNLSKKISVSNLTAGATGLRLQVDGTLVPPTSGIINIVDSQAVANRILAANYNTNQISFELDSTTPVWVSDLNFLAGGTVKLTMDVAGGGTAYSLLFPATQGAASTFLRNDGAGNLSWAAETGTGTVTSVGLSAPAEFIVSGSPVTTSGTLTLTKANQAANLVYAGPSSGTAAAPTFRALAAQDISGLAVTSVGLSAPAEFIVSGSPVTTSGTLAFAKANQTVNVVYAGPSSGADTAPTFRALATADVQSIANTGIRADANAFVKGDITFAGGSNVMLSQAGNTITINSAGGGGGGGSFTGTAIWTGGTSSKDAYTAPSVVNTQAITITLIASAGTGQITAATVRLNGVALVNTYATTGTWPNLTLTIPSADLTGNAAETATAVAIDITGTFSGGGIHIANAGTLTNVQPIAFTTTLSGSYGVASAPFYTTTAQLNYSYSNSDAIISFGGVFTPGGNATAPAFNFQNVAITGSIISGSATGNGTHGAGSTTVTLSGSVASVPTYTPAFYVQTANNTPPTFTSASTQTAGAAQASTITYPLATASTQFDWICTQRPLANILLSTPFGNSLLVPDVTAPTQTISGQVFSVYGFTRLTVGQSATLVIT